MEFQSYITQQGREHPAFTSPFNSHAEAASAIYDRHEQANTMPENFEASLLVAYEKAASRGWGLSEGRAYWLHKLAMPQQQPVESIACDVTGIKTMLDKAAETLKSPAIRIADGETQFRISRAKDTSKNPGFCYVASPTFGGAYYGKISPTGEFFAGKDCNDTVLDFLGRLSEDPAGVAAAYGKKTGSCCFCNRLIETNESLAVGYGPVCADRYGLPWGIA